MKQYAFHGVAAVFEFKGHCFGRSFFELHTIISVSGLARCDPGKVDHPAAPVAGRHQPEPVIFFRVLQIMRRNDQLRLSVKPRFKTDEDILLILQCLQDGPEVPDVFGIFIIVSIRIPVIINDHVRRKEGLDIFKSGFLKPGHIRHKEPDPRIQQQRFHPPFLQNRQRHGRLLLQRSGQIFVDQPPFFTLKPVRDRQKTLSECVLLHKGVQLFPCQGTAHRFLQDRGNRNIITAVDFMKQHRFDLRVSQTFQTVHFRLIFKILPETGSELFVCTLQVGDPACKRPQPRQHFKGFIHVC